MQCAVILGLGIASVAVIARVVDDWVVWFGRRR